MLTPEELRKVISSGITLTTEKGKNRLLSRLLTMAMDIAGCDAGTLYLYREEQLFFKLMKTLSQNVSHGENGEVIDMPPVGLVEGNVCAYSAIHGELVNIPDVYYSERFDFSGPRKYDAITGYRTGSMLVIPLLDAEDVLIGVLQLINKLDEDGGFIPFTADDEFVIQSLGSMTAVSMSNMLYIEEIKAQMFSFVQAFAVAVDERTPYNGTHTRKVTIYAALLAKKINELHEQGKTEEYFDKSRREQLVLAAALHDIGKMIVPLTVMNKATRLDSREETVKERFAYIKVLYERDMLKGRCTPQEYDRLCRELSEDLACIEECNAVGFLQEDKAENIRRIAGKAYVGEDLTLPYLTKEEEECLLVVKGTLTKEERRIMESHVKMTEKILDKVRFNRKYSQVKEIAATHHEYLNGSGYPGKLTADKLSLETRILTIVDVFDALTCTDRPYKVPLSRERSFQILHAMAKDGQVEEYLVAGLEEMLAGVDEKQIEEFAASEDWCFAIS